MNAIKNITGSLRTLTEKQERKIQHVMHQYHMDEGWVAIYEDKTVYVFQEKPGTLDTFHYQLPKEKKQ